VTATEIQVAHAAEAVRLGRDVAETTMQAAAATPGLGHQVALPSVVGVLGRPTQGEGYNLPDSTPALRPVAHVAAPVTYGSPLIGGATFGGVTGLLDALEGVAVPAYRVVSTSSPRTPLLSRLRDAFDALLGRR
jgi:hypothetical protein